MDGLNGANLFSAEDLEALFQDEEAQATPPANDEESSDGDAGKDDAGKQSKPVDTTKAFATRLKESTEKARLEEREAIAKSLGFDSYDALVKSKEDQVITDKGLDPSVVTPVVEEIVKQRIDNDPRMKELAEYRKRQVAEFGKKELAEITALTGGEITSLAQLSREVLDLWAKKGSLKSAYLELEGEKLINKVRGEQSKGGTAHLNTPSGGTNASSGKRYLTAEEKQMWRFFNPGMTEEELNKKMIDK